jgi:hypothetical protein
MMLTVHIENDGTTPSSSQTRELAVPSQIDVVLRSRHKTVPEIEDRSMVSAKKDIGNHLIMSSTV